MPRLLINYTKETLDDDLLDAIKVAIHEDCKSSGDFDDWLYAFEKLTDYAEGCQIEKKRLECEPSATTVIKVKKERSTTDILFYAFMVFIVGVIAALSASIISAC